MRDNGGVNLPLAQTVFAASLRESDAAFCLRRTFDDEADTARRAEIRRQLTPRTPEAQQLATSFGCGDAWQWILEHALIRRKVRPQWEPLRSQHEVLRAMRSAWRAIEKDAKAWRSLVSDARRLEEPVP